MKNELELINAAKAGNERAFAILFETHKENLTKLIGSKLRKTNLESDVEDILIEGFMKAFSNIHKFEPKFTFKTWLGKICLNHMLDAIRKKKLNTVSINNSFNQNEDDENSDLNIQIQSNELNPIELLMENDKADIARDLISSLPEKLKQVVNMRFLEQKSYEEISIELDLPLGSVKSAMFRAKGIMLESLKGDNAKERILY